MTIRQQLVNPDYTDKAFLLPHWHTPSRHAEAFA